MLGPTINEKNTRGVALLYVVILLLFLSAVSAVLLAAAQAAAQQSTFADRYESMYYDAEAALQVALRLFEDALVIPSSAEGENEHEARGHLQTALQEALAYCQRVAEKEATDYLAAAGKTVTVDAAFFIDSSAIMTRPLSADPGGKSISFFGSGMDSDGNVAPATPVRITITAQCGTRSVTIERMFTVTGGHFTAAVPGTPGEEEAGNGLWLAGKNLLNGSADWLVHNNTMIQCPDGLSIINYKDFPPGEIVFPGRTMASLMQPPMNVANEIREIQDKARAAYENPENSVYTVTGYDNPVITPETLKKPDGTYHNVLYGNQGGFTLSGDFTATGLKAIYFTGVSKVTLGSSTASFSCDKNSSASPVSDGEPLYVYIPTTSEIVLSGETRVANAKFAFGNTATMTGNSGSAEVYYDAQLYYQNPITIGESASHPLVVNNWDPTGVPSFVSTNTMRVYVKSETGFSGVFYTDGTLTASIDAPKVNGAFLMQNTPTLTFKNTSSLYPGAVRLYCEINGTARSNMSPSLTHYFDAIISEDEREGVVGGGEMAGGTDAYYTVDMALTGDNTADRNAVIYES